jgi:hypothetical protein
MNDEMIDELVTTAAQLAVLFAGEPHEQTLAALYDVCGTPEAELSMSLGVEVATFDACRNERGRQIRRPISY